MENVTQKADARDAILNVAQRTPNVRAVVASLAAHLDCHILLFSTGGEILVRSTETDTSGSPALVHDLWARLMPHSFGGRRDMILDNWRVIIRPLRSAGAVVHVLVAMSHLEKRSEPDATLLDFGARVMELLLSADKVATRARARNRSDLLVLVLTQKIDDSHIGWLIAHGFAAGNDLQALVVAPAPDPDVGADRVGLSASNVQELEHFLESSGTTYLAARVGSLYVVLVSIVPDVPGELHGFDVHTPARTSLDEFADRTGICVGVSTCLRGLASVPVLLGQAVLSLEAAIEGRYSVVNHSGLPGLVRFMDSLPDSAISSLALRLAPVKAARHPVETNQRLLTLRAFLDNDGSVATAAKHLHLHANSLRKRLKSIEAAMDIDLSTTDGLVTARLSLLANTVLDARAHLPAKSE